VLTIALGLGAALSYAVSDFLAQRVTRGGATVVSTLIWVLATGTAITVPVALLVAGLPHGRAEFVDVGYAATGGAVYLVAYASLVRGLRVGNISLVTPLASLQGAVAAIIAILLLSEPVTGLKAAGLALAICGSLLAAIGPHAPDGQSAKAPATAVADPAAGVAAQAPADAVWPARLDRARRRLGTAAGAGWGLLCAVAFGIVLIFYGAVTSLSPLTAVAVSRVVSLLLILPLALRFGVHMPRHLRPTALVSGALEASGFLLVVLALTVGPVAVASVLVAQFATFAVLLGLFVGHERPSRTQFFGVLCTIVAVTVQAMA
jgi:drug/metabolite transporter (DMT)-like permease